MSTENTTPFIDSLDPGWYLKIHSNMNQHRPPRHLQAFGRLQTLKPLQALRHPQVVQLEDHVVSPFHSL